MSEIPSNTGESKLCLKRLLLTEIFYKILLSYRPLKEIWKIVSSAIRCQKKAIWKLVTNTSHTFTMKASYSQLQTITYHLGFYPFLWIINLHTVEAVVQKWSLLQENVLHLFQLLHIYILLHEFQTFLLEALCYWDLLATKHSVHLITLQIEITCWHLPATYLKVQGNEVLNMLGLSQ